MHRNTLLALLSAAGIHQAAADAPKTSGNPPSAIYKATFHDPFFPGADLPGPLMGNIVAQAPPDGKGVTFDVFFNNLPVGGGPFTYHLHKLPVPADGNCTATSSHLDPYGAGADITCDPTKPATCEVGDLSGKHGAVESVPFRASYTDAYASTNQYDDAFFGDLSFVIHYSNSTRLACANFEKIDCAAPSSSTEAPSTTVPPYPIGAPNSTVVAPTGGSTEIPTGSPTDSPGDGSSEPPDSGAVHTMGGAMSLPMMLMGGVAAAWALAM